MITSLIPARRGSTRVINKNLSIINGRNLIQRAIDFSNKVNVDQITVFTDYSADEVGCDAKLIHNRSLCNAQKNSLADEYLKEILPKLEFRTIALLQPTTPFRSEKFFKVMLAKYLELNNIDVLVASGTPFKESLWEKNKDNFYIRSDASPRNQLLRRTKFIEDGAFYIFDRIRYLQLGGLDSFKWCFSENEFPYNLDINNDNDIKTASIMSKFYD
jgi:CMP-N-acetylneuraminic acid synthetase